MPFSINPSLLVYVLDNFDSGLENFGIVSQEVFNELLLFLSSHDIKAQGNRIDISTHNKVAIALVAVCSGADLVSVCSKINWRDFESFASEIIKFHGYAVHANFRLSNPRREIDIVGIKSQKALLVDCKHWKKNSLSALKQIVEKQKTRSVLFLKKTKMNIQSAFPVILTFLPGVTQFVDGVPVVSINALNSFLTDFDANCQNFYKIRAF